MKGRICCFLIALQMVSRASATSRTFPSNYNVGAHQPGPVQNSESSTVTLSAAEGFKSEKARINEEVIYKGASKIGSIPPSCEHKCRGCIPCDAIQVPTTSRHSNVGIQFANYEPEGWKCKCGPFFYSP
ncbi:EPIDERMAL PATTERNING FACTOR-like protein 6 [Juglans microcarpa x Juglans regia]|uniref:EPIDERMAL PATTERNING FACTOR-like protein 6 n=1 Tax=Juglans microcarpa x Juglans regia TaxID=2249226 RepID=UPI001B7EF661|nr:EPIDERMAL PATTERNING FACTOR-like protein 6 [Juglans microcarpa x Juglans regia]